MSPVYEWRCRDCGRQVLNAHREPMPCICGSVLRRVYHVNITRVMHGHFNHSLGRYVEGRSDFAEQLKRQSEEASQRTGIEHNFQPVDPSDTKAIGVTEDGMDATHRKQMAEGKIEPKSYL